MGLFSFTQELAMDLGTANTIITCNDKMVVDEPSVIALDARSEKVLAVGRQAREMYEKTNPNIRTIRPLREGVIADIGGGTTEIAVISLGGIVSNKSIKMAGDDLTNDIVEYMRRQHNIRVSERMAERIKINVGSALSILEDAPEDFEVCGPNQMTALPMKVPVSYQEIAHCLDKSISKIEAAVLSALEQTPPELYADIVKNGIYLAGGGALLRGIDKRLRDKMGIEFHVADDPLHAVARGTGIALKNIDKFNFLIR